VTAHKMMPQTDPFRRESWTAQPDVYESHPPTGCSGARSHMQVEASGKRGFNREAAAFAEQNPHPIDGQSSRFHSGLFRCSRRKGISDLVRPHDFFDVRGKVGSVCALTGSVWTSEQPEPRGAGHADGSSLTTTSLPSALSRTSKRRPSEVRLTIRPEISR
jgi:hypothetical protein